MSSRHSRVRPPYETGTLQSTRAMVLHFSPHDLWDEYLGEVQKEVQAAQLIEVNQGAGIANYG